MMTRPARFPAFQSRAYRLYWTGQLAGNIGSWMQIVATGWLVLQLTNSPAALGVNAALQAIPLLLLSLVGGLIADRVDRYRLMILAHSAQLILEASVAFLVGTGLIRVEHIYVYSVLSAIQSGLSNPAKQAFVPRLVPREALQSALALNAVLWQGAPIIGPSLAGIILGFWGVPGSFYANVVLHVVGLGALLGLRLPKEQPRNITQAPWQFFVEGARYTWENRRVRLLLIAVALLSLFGRPYVQILPVFARDVFEVGPQGLGLMLTMPAVGTIAAGALLAAFTARAPARWFLVTSTGLGLALCAFGLLPWFWASLLVLAVMGACVSASTTLVNTGLQQALEDRLRGRVMSFEVAATWGGWRLGALPMGLAAEAVGAPLAVSAAGLLLIVALVPFLLQPELRAHPAPTRADEMTDAVIGNRSGRRQR